MSAQSTPVSRHGDADVRPDVVIIGAGILGLFNALQLAKRGLRVTVVDNLQGRKESYKVGESMLVFTNAFLRTIGGIEPFLPTSFPKQGVWCAYGTEGKASFDRASEWVAQADLHPPHYMYDEVKADKWSRCMFLDMQIVRPEIERFLCDQVRENPLVTFVDDGKVQDVRLGEGDDLHEIDWVSGAALAATTASARWVIDCSGRNRFMARKMKHAVDLDDGFQTTAAWGQFSGITDAQFDERWAFTFDDGGETSRDRFTVHLWGEGYWIWVIRLGGERVSVGVTWDQRRAPKGDTPKEQFWDVMKRHPVLEGMVSEETLLEFRSYRDVQYLTDTFVSERRYGIVGDAAGIIDAYYSQGISLAMATSWHIANIAERDVREGKLDREYIEHVNTAMGQDWQITRNMVREKFSPAIADSRFFALSHLLDFIFLFASGTIRADLTRWLVDTEGDTAKETPALTSLRKRLEKQLFFSQATPWAWARPDWIPALQRRLQAGLAERARFRLEHGIEVPTFKTIVGFTKPVPPMWRIPFLSAKEITTLFAADLVRSGGGKDATWFERLPISTYERLRWVIRLRYQAAMGLFACLYAYDLVDTEIQRLRAPRPVERPARSQPERAPVRTKPQQPASTAAMESR